MGQLFDLVGVSIEAGNYSKQHQQQACSAMPTFCCAAALLLESH
jgi:hypothetical protein